MKAQPFTKEQVTENIKDLNLTKMEHLVLRNIILNLYAEAGFTDLEASDLTKNLLMEMKVLRGVISSLVQKGYISVDEFESSSVKRNFICLREEFYHLHPLWRTAVKGEDDAEEPEQKEEELTEEYIESITEVPTKPICKLVNDKFSWVLKVDGRSIWFDGSDNADYFAELYRNLGYEIEWDRDAYKQV